MNRAIGCIGTVCRIERNKSDLIRCSIRAGVRDNAGSGCGGLSVSEIPYSGIGIDRQITKFHIRV